MWHGRFFATLLSCLKLFWHPNSLMLLWATKTGNCCGMLQSVTVCLFSRVVYIAHIKGKHKCVAESEWKMKSTMHPYNIQTISFITASFLLYAMWYIIKCLFWLPIFVTDNCFPNGYCCFLALHTVHTFFTHILSLM